MIGSNLDNTNGDTYPDLGQQETKLVEAGINFNAYAFTESASLGKHRANAIWAVHGEQTVIRTRHSRTNSRGGVSLLTERWGWVAAFVTTLGCVLTDSLLFNSAPSIGSSVSMSTRTGTFSTLYATRATVRG